MKKFLAGMLSLTFALGLTAGCSSAPTAESSSPPPAESEQATSDQPAEQSAEQSADQPPDAAQAVTLNVFSTYAGSDGNAPNYQDALAAWQQGTGNKINDTSATADETVKGRIRTDFSAGSEPDVLFYFTGADASSFLDKVLTVDEIRAQYPSYATNMREDTSPKATDGKWYAVPVNGYWENLFVNKKVLDAAGVSLPDAGYTWDQFLIDCQKIKDAGLTPIAASFVDVPHYWWELSIFNNTSPATHNTIPQDINDDAAKAWIAGMNDIKAVYDKGFFPENALSAKDEELQELFFTDQAAFLLDGSWRANTIVTRASDDDEKIDEARLAEFTVVNFPDKGLGRKSTDVIGGMSSGWYITRKAWDDPAKQAAVVDFVTFMSSDEQVSKFAGANSATALQNGVTVDEATLNSLNKEVIAIINAATAFTPAVQDAVSGDARDAMFQAIPQMLTGSVTADQLIGDFIAAFTPA
ncbi:MAG: extracellular solute-binding protein [Clostridiales bacterium]|jgi:raffinose/stachyose/melibiose transport system substrate-binding protein|nr:extracellular solute-binding protein [Clostridiales bacterium]